MGNQNGKSEEASRRRVEREQRNLKKGIRHYQHY